MKTPLASIRDCFEGVIPSIIATLDADGLPNVSYLSQVYLVDDEHVALSNQFFSKTAANVAATGRAHVLLVSGRTGEQFALDVEHRASLTDGAVFAKMSAQLTAISSQHGVGEAMVLRSAELYRVNECRAIPGPPTAAEPAHATAQDRLALAAKVAAAIAAQSDAELMIDAAIHGLESAFGFANAMLLMLDDDGGRLTTLASCGYAHRGAGSEVLQSRAVEFAKNYGVTLEVLSSFEVKPGTLVREEDKQMEQMIIRGIAADKNQAKATLLGVPDTPGVAARIFKALAAANINVDMIVQNVSAAGVTDVSFTVAKDDINKTQRTIEPLVKQIKAAGLSFDGDIAKVSLVGVGMKSHSGVAYKMFDVLAANKINIEMISTSEIKISVAIRAQEADRAVRALHDAFGMGKPAPKKKAAKKAAAKKK